VSRRIRSEKTLVVVLTWRVGLSEWERARILERELKLFDSYCQKNIKVVLITSSANDFANKEYWKEKLGDLSIVFVKPGFLSGIFSIKLNKTIREIALKSKRNPGSVSFKTNQLLGLHFLAFIPKSPLSKVTCRLGFSPLDQELEMKKLSLRIFKLQVYERIWMRYASQWEFSSSQIRDQICERQRVIRPTTVIGNFVDVDIWKHREKAVSASRNVIGFYGRFTKQKNLENLIKAIKDIESLRLELIGDGEQMTELVSLVQQLNLQHRVYFYPRSSQLEIVNLSKDWFCAILPSVVEGNPKMVLEMFARGVPVVGSDVNGIKQVIRHRRNGFLMTSGSVEEIERTLIELTQLADSDLENICSRARNWVVKHHELKTIVRKQIKFYF